MGFGSPGQASRTRSKSLFSRGVQIKMTFTVEEDDDDEDGAASAAGMGSQSVSTPLVPLARSSTDGGCSPFFDSNLFFIFLMRISSQILSLV